MLILLQGEGGLPTGHGQVNVGQNFGIQQSTMQGPMGVVDAIAFAQCIEVVALAGMELAGVVDLRSAPNPPQ